LRSTQVEPTPCEKKLHPELYFKILFSKEDCTAEKGTEKRKMVFEREIYFEKNTVE
jgi:hypothetical protein